MISKYYYNFLADYFGSKKSYKLIVQKYYWLLFWFNIVFYIKDYNACLALEKVRYIPYKELKSLLISKY